MGINAVRRITRTRPFLRERLIDFGLVLGAGLLMMIFLFATPLPGLFREITEYFVPDEAHIAREFIWYLAAQLTSLFLTFLTFLVLYRYLPNTGVRFSDVWVGALVAAGAFEGAKWGFVWYVRTFSIYNFVYGSVGAVMALLTWVYVSAIILLFGALLTSRYAGYDARSKEERGLKPLWTGLSLVRLRVVGSLEAG